MNSTALINNAAWQNSGGNFFNNGNGNNNFNWNENGNGNASSNSNNGANVMGSNESHTTPHIFGTAPAINNNQNNIIHFNNGHAAYNSNNTGNTFQTFVSSNNNNNINVFQRLNSSSNNDTLGNNHNFPISEVVTLKSPPEQTNNNNNCDNNQHSVVDESDNDDDDDDDEAFETDMMKALMYLDKEVTAAEEKKKKKCDDKKCGGSGGAVGAGDAGGPAAAAATAGQASERCTDSQVTTQLSTSSRTITSNSHANNSISSHPNLTSGSTTYFPPCPDITITIMPPPSASPSMNATHRGMTPLTMESYGEDENSRASSRLLSHDQSLALQETTATTTRRSKRKRKEIINDPNHPRYTFMKIHNQYPTLPIAVARLISDLIDASKSSIIGNGDDCARDNNNVNKSRRNNITCFTSLSEVLEDLNQMVIEPSTFLSDPRGINANKLDFERKLYGREKEISQMLTVANAISTTATTTRQTPAPGKGLLEIISIGGYSGSGKSSLVRQVGRYLSLTKGWFFLQGKFDRMKTNEGMSVVTSAFENFCLILQAMKTRGGMDDLEYCSRVSSAVTKALGSSGIQCLSQLIPSLGNLIGRDGGGGATSSTLVYSQENGIVRQTASDAIMSKSRLEYLLCAFLESILLLGRPIFLFYDDVQWAEAATLDFLGKFLKHLADSSAARSHLLYVQCYRDNEVDEKDPMHVAMSRVQSSDTSNWTNIRLDAFDKKALNDVVSHVLHLPRRITCSLSEVLHQKTSGNVLFLIEFMKTLQDPKKLLHYSVSRRQWRWDADSIALMAISGSVAGLLMNKIMSLEKNVMDCLIIGSCFGNQMNSLVVQNLEGLRGTMDIVANLNSLVDEGLLDKAGPLFMFSHDAIQQTVYELTPEEERTQLHIDIGTMLISKGSSSSPDIMDEIFTLSVDHINAALKCSKDKIATEFSLSQRVVFAKLNLKAATKDISSKADFSLAKEHLNAAMSFLPEDHWDSHYDLTLQIYDEYTNVLLVKHRFDEIFDHIDLILQNGRSVSDKIQAHEARISALYTSGSKLKAIYHARSVLEELGFPFPSTVQDETVVGVMNASRRSTVGFTLENIHKYPVMKESVILHAMRIMRVAMVPCSLVDQSLYPLIACQMLQLTIRHGLCVDSASAFAAVGYSQLSRYHDYEEGYRLGKLAMAIIDRFDAKNIAAHVAFMVYGFLSVWKEPIQSTAERLAYYSDLGFKEGDQNSALLNSVCCLRQELLAGKELNNLCEKSERLCRVMTFNKSKNNYFAAFNPLLGDVYLLTALSGRSDQRVSTMFIPHSENERILFERSRSGNDSTNGQLIQYHRLSKAFWFREYGIVLECCKEYGNCKPTKHQLLRVTDICQSFYGGIAAFILSRKLHRKIYIAEGENYLAMTQAWVNGSDWNFENKLILLQAEYHYAKGEKESAEKAYEKSIASARKHKFIHEEALATELFGIFCIEEGNLKKGRDLIERATSLYRTWGAHKKAEYMYPL